MIVLYSGNNEFLERIVYRQGPLAEPARPLAVPGVRSFRVSIPSRGNSGKSRKSTSRTTVVMTRSRTGSALHSAGERSSSRIPFSFQTVADHFRYNLESMVRAGQERGVSVVLVHGAGQPEGLDSGRIHPPGKHLHRRDGRLRESLP